MTNPSEWSVQRLDITQADFDARLERLTSWDATTDRSIETAVREIIEAVRKCPSGALSYSVDGVEHRDVPDQTPSISIMPNGPYGVTGGCGLADTEWGPSFP